MGILLKRSPKCLSVIRTEEGTRENLEIWEQIKKEYLKSLFEHRSAALITDNELIFKENNIHASAELPINRFVSTERTTFVLVRKNWPIEELNKIATSTQFELSELYMQPDAASATFKLYENFWDFAASLHDVSFNPENIESDIQTITCLGDGSWIIWTNPVSDLVASVLDHLKKYCSQMYIAVSEE